MCPLSLLFPLGSLKSPVHGSKLVLNLPLLLSKVFLYQAGLASIIIWLFTNYASHCRGQRSRDKQGQSRDKAVTNSDKQGQTRTNTEISFLFLLVPVRPRLSMHVPDCPCLSHSVPVCLYICYTFMSTHADEYNSLHQYKHSYINFHYKSHCSNACKTCF